MLKNREAWFDTDDLQLYRGNQDHCLSKIVKL